MVLTIAMRFNGVFVVRFHNLEGKKVAIELCQYSMTKS